MSRLASGKRNIDRSFTSTIGVCEFARILSVRSRNSQDQREVDVIREVKPH